jgi:flagellar basal-body rod modification protein FlgD
MTVSTNYATTVPATSLQSSSAAGTTASTSSAASASSAKAGSSVTTLTSLAGNFNDFITLLTTQLQNQDPTAPLDTNQFTSQLVQFTGVAEQITTNSTLSSMLTAELSQQLTNASSLVGQTVSISGGTLPLQNGAASLTYQATGPGPVQVSIADSSGNPVYSQVVQAASGSNNWSWNGLSSSGKQEPDGGYTASVINAAGGAVPFQTTGTVTGAEQGSSAVNLEFGSASVGFGNIVSLGSTKSSSTQ